MRKVWLDDGDLLRRVPVTLGLFYAGESDPVATTVVNAAGSWIGRISYTPTGGQTSDYADYYVREIPGGSLTFDDYATYLPGGEGYARTTNTRYYVTTQKTGQSTYTVTNRRVGKLTITVDKQWAVADLGSQPLVALFELYKEGDTFVESKTVPLSGGSTVFENLDKFDENGGVHPLHRSRGRHLRDRGRRDPHTL